MKDAATVPSRIGGMRLLTASALSGLVLVSVWWLAAGRAACAADDSNERAGEMKRIAESLTLHAGQGPQRRPLVLRPEPLLRWNDPTRKFSDASLWAWGGPGRPEALLALELYPHSERGEDFVPSWAYEFVSLSDGPLDAEGGGEAGEPVRGEENGRRPPVGLIRWSPSKRGVRFDDIPDAPAPAPTVNARTVQMRELTKRFTAKEHPGETVSLRLMPHPVARYADPERGQVDGAIFVLANGTNPEVLLLLEAQGAAAERARYRFAIARTTAAPFEVALDRRDARTERFASEQRDPGATYFTLRLPRSK
jgi:hypothetical protein